MPESEIGPDHSNVQKIHIGSNSHVARPRTKGAVARWRQAGNKAAAAGTSRINLSIIRSETNPPKSKP
jgi:hypothetical protein